MFGKFSSTKQETISEETSTTRESMEPLSQQYTLVKRDAIEVEDDANNREIHIEHTLVDCTTIENPSSEQGKSAGPREHMIVECVTVEEKSPADREASGHSQHTIAECETMVVESSPSSVVEEHRLVDCDTVPASEDEPPSQELSYVHDFTDCPVDKAILEYYEKEERKAQQHELTDRIRTSLPTELLQVNKPRIQQHTLAECSEDENTPPSSPSRHRSTSYNMDRSKKDDGKLRQHRLVSCPTPPVLFHHVAENALAINSEDSQATQRPIYHDKLRAEEMDKSTDDISSESASGSGETNSGGSTEDPANPDIVRRKRRRHKQHRKAITQFLVSTSSGNKPVPVRSGSAQHSLAQVLAANRGKREKAQKSRELEKPSKKKGKDKESSAATGHDTSVQKSEDFRSEVDPRSPGVVQNDMSGLWSKLTTSTKEKNGQSLS